MTKFDLFVVSARRVGTALAELFIAGQADPRFRAISSSDWGELWDQSWRQVEESAIARAKTIGVDQRTTDAFVAIARAEFAIQTGRRAGILKPPAGKA